MRDLDLLGDWLVRQRRSALQYAHACTLGRDTDLLQVKALAYQAEFCDRVLEAVKVLAKDPGKFIQEFMPHEYQ
jgi:hypothetical protein